MHGIAFDLLCWTLIFTHFCLIYRFGFFFKLMGNVPQDISAHFFSWEKIPNVLYSYIFLCQRVCLHFFQKCAILLLLKSLNSKRSVFFLKRSTAKYGQVPRRPGEEGAMHGSQLLNINLQSILEFQLITVH